MLKYNAIYNWLWYSDTTCITENNNDNMVLVTHINKRLLHFWNNGTLSALNKHKVMNHESWGLNNNNLLKSKENGYKNIKIYFILSSFLNS